MLKGSFSLSRLRWLDEVVETFDLECQNVGFSCCGEGYGQGQPMSERTMGQRRLEWAAAMP